MNIGILPICLKGGNADGDLGRAALLLDSLKANWRGERPFELTVVSPHRDRQEISSTLKSSQSVTVECLVEEEFFNSSSIFFQMSGWYKQQVIKIIVPYLMNFGSYIALDSDCILLRYIDENTFIKNGRLVSAYEPRAAHEDWWAHTAENLGLGLPDAEFGLGVTPNILHSDISAAVVEYLGGSGHHSNVDSAIDWLYLRIDPGKEKVPWTEYTLYDLIGNHLNIFNKYHNDFNTYFELEIQIMSDKNIWNPSEVKKLINPRDQDINGYFLVVQSTLGIPIQIVRERVERHFRALQSKSRAPV